MTLAERMNEIADDDAPRMLPTPDDIRRAAAAIRQQRRTRATVAAIVLVVVAVVSAVAIAGRPAQRSAPEPVGPIHGWHLTRSIQVPGSGATLYGDGSLWVVDMKDQQLTADRTAPAGDLYQVDPESGATLARIPTAVGGWPAVGAGAIWLSTAAGGLDTLTRVDLSTHAVTRTATSHPAQLPHGVALAGGNLWVANWATGDLVRMDPTTQRVRQRIHLGDPRAGRSPQSLISDGHSLWVGDDNGLVTRFDGDTGVATSRLQLPLREVRFDGVDLQRRVLYAHAVRGGSLFEIDLGRGAPDRLGRELPLVLHRGDAMLAAFAVGSGSLWAATLNPDRLIRVDPDTFKISDQAALTGLDHGSNAPVALAASGQTIWVRTDDTLVQLAPDPGPRP